MRSKILKHLTALRRCSSGNATLLVAMSMPMLIGGAGLGVDLTQWYMWKRELQYAVDQAAMAGAWARADASTAANYTTRATQEFNANLATTNGNTTSPVIGLSNYAGGSNNSVTVHATTSRALPFSSLVANVKPNVYAYAQAAFEKGTTFTSCLIATDDHATGALTIGGSSVLTASCGLAALSDADEAISVNGNPTIDAGYILAKGGIDPWLKANTDDTILEHMSGLYDPFKDLQPPSPTETQVNRTYACTPGTKTTRSNVQTDVNTTYTYWKGADPATAVQYTNNKGKAKETTSSTAAYTIVSNDTIDGVVYTTTVTWTQTNNASGASATWEKKTTVTSNTYSGTTSTTTVAQASVTPGTYSNIKVSCQTNFSTGVYVIDGGGLEVDGQYQVSGSGVMFVLKNGAYIKINGGSNINLTAIQASDLIARGVTSAQANLLAGMLVFEDRAGASTSKNNVNGNATTVLNGTIYLPKSNIDFSGTASVTSQCLMIAAATINITGTANMKTFCPAGSIEDTTVATLVSKVKLVA